MVHTIKKGANAPFFLFPHRGELFDRRLDGFDVIWMDPEVSLKSDQTSVALSLLVLRLVLSVGFGWWFLFHDAPFID